MRYTLSEIAHKIGAKLHLKGQADAVIQGLAPIENSGSAFLSFLSNSKYTVHLAQTKAAGVILTEALLELCPVAALVMKDPYVGFAKAAKLFDDTPQPSVGIHPSAVIHPGVTVPASASIGAFVVVAEGVSLGERVVIGEGSVIAAGCSIGEGSILKPRVVLYHRVKVGKDCLIHSGAVLGSDGFGLANDNGLWLKVPQLGSVELEDEVEIGANTTIDRGAIENTLIKRGVKIDNQVQIAHNVVIGEGSALAAQVGIAGSSEVGRHCLLGGKVGINGHIKIGDGVIVTAMSGISKNIETAGVYSASMPARPVLEWNKFLARLNRIEKIMGKKKHESGSN